MTQQFDKWLLLKVIPAYEALKSAPSKAALR